MRDHLDWKGEEGLSDQVGVPAVGERVEEAGQHRLDDLALPALHRARGEGLLHQRAVQMVVGFVHLGEGATHHEAGGLRVDRVRVDLVVAQQFLHRVERHHRVGRRVADEQRFHLLHAEAVPLHPHEHRRFLSHLAVHRVWVAHLVGPGRALELGEGVVPLVTRRVVGNVVGNLVHAGESDACPRWRSTRSRPPTDRGRNLTARGRRVLSPVTYGR